MSAPRRSLAIAVLAVMTVMMASSCAPKSATKPAPTMIPSSAPTPPASTPPASTSPAPTPSPAQAPSPAPPKPPEQPAPQPAPHSAPGAKLVELFPGVRADLAARVVEFDGIVPLNAHDPVTPIVYLEVLVCTPDTKEHEALVMTRAKPSHVHAALLAAGFIPGEPGRWDWDGTKLLPRAPKGDGLAVLFVRRGEDGREIEEPAETWVKRERDGKPITASDDGPRWRFAGSQMVKRGPGGTEVYDADGAGTLIGLTTFGSETIAWHRTISPEATVEEPDLIADAAKVPKMGTPVTVRIRAAR